MNPLKYTRKNRSRISENCPCGRSNRDGKFIPFDGYKDKGFCHSCNESFFPDNNTPVKPDPGHRYAQKIEQKFIDAEVVACTLGGFKNNNFVKWLTNLIGVEASKKVINRFCIGTSKTNGTIFWTIDQNLRICRPKVFYFNLDGHRDKNTPPLVPSGYTRNSGYLPCLFGLHQINEKYGQQKPIALVESEKSAVLGFHAFKKFNFLGLGGATLSRAKAEPLKGNQIVIVPDADIAGREGAVKTRERLAELGIHANICDLFPDKDSGYDIADFLADSMMEKTIDKMKSKNPAVKTLVEKFEFEEC